MERNIERVLLSREQIESKVTELAAILTEEYADKNPVFIGVLKGVVMFFADVVRKVNIPCQIDFMCTSSYSGTVSTGKTQISKDVSVNLYGRHLSPSAVQGACLFEDLYTAG